MIQRELIKIIKKLQGLEKKEAKSLKEEIDKIIENNINDTDKIEKYFDDLLSLAYFDYKLINETFTKLINYTNTINPEISEFYLKKYLEIIGRNTKIKSRRYM